MKCWKLIEIAVGKFAVIDAVEFFIYLPNEILELAPDWELI
jgi:hypothetical protein